MTAEHDVEVYPVANRRTRTGRPWRWRYRILRTGRVKSFASPQQAAQHLQTHYPDLKVVSDVFVNPTSRKEPSQP